MALTVTGVYAYPVKSCAGVALEQGVLTPTGFRYDRNWVVVNAKGRFMSQRQRPEMALVQVDIQPRALLEDTEAEEGQYPDAALVLRAPGMPTLHVPLNPGTKGKDLEHVTVWDWVGKGANEGPEAAAWWTKYLGADMRLLRYAGVCTPGLGNGPPTATPTRREVEPEWTEGRVEETAFSDGFPYLIASETSLADLNTKIPAGEGPLLMNRFRANIVVGGAEPWAEDGWARLGLGGGVSLRLVKPCSRCAIPTTEQETGEVGYEPLRTLRTMRSGKVLGWDVAAPEFKGEVFFAWNALTEGQGGVVVKGTTVDVLELRDGPAKPIKVAPRASPAAGATEAGAAPVAAPAPPRLTTLHKIGLALVFLLLRILIRYLAGKE